MCGSIYIKYLHPIRSVFLTNTEASGQFACSLWASVLKFVKNGNNNFLHKAHFPALEFLLFTEKNRKSLQAFQCSCLPWRGLPCQNCFPITERHTGGIHSSPAPCLTPAAPSFEMHVCLVNCHTSLTAHLQGVLL